MILWQFRKVRRNIMNLIKKKSIYFNKMLLKLKEISKNSSKLVMSALDSLKAN